LGRRARSEVFGKGDGYKTLEVPIQTLKDLLAFTNAPPASKDAIHICEARWLPGTRWLPGRRSPGVGLPL
jgi:hypothetical protein